MSCQPVGRVAAAILLGLGCFPEADLASYSEGAPADASVEPGSFDRGEDAGVGDAAAEPLPPGAEAGAPDVDAGGFVRLSCRDECACELREGRDFMFCVAPAVTRATAAARCRDAGGALVSIESEALAEWLSQRMTALGSDDYWTSGSDEEVEGTWRWADGRVFYEAADAAAADAFTAWVMNQPNGGPAENCLRAVGGVWRDLGCDEPAAYVCER